MAGLFFSSRLRKHYSRFRDRVVLAFVLGATLDLVGGGAWEHGANVIRALDDDIGLRTAEISRILRNHGRDQLAHRDDLAEP